MSDRPATVAGCGAIVLWMSLAVLTKFAGAVPPLQITALAFWTSGAIGLGIVAARGRLGALRQPAAVWAHGAGGLFGYHALYFAALGMAPVAEVNLVNYLWPLLIVLLSAALLGLRLRAAHVAGAGLGLAGCALLIGRGARFDAHNGAGYALALGAAVVWALYSVLSRRFAHVPAEVVAGFCLVTALLASIAHAAFEPTVLPSRAAALAIFVMGAGPVGAAFYQWDHGTKRGDPRLLATIAFAIPVGSTLLLCAAGFATLSWALVAAACLVAAGGLVAAAMPRCWRV